MDFKPEMIEAQAVRLETRARALEIYGWVLLFALSVPGAIWIAQLLQMAVGLERQIVPFVIALSLCFAGPLVLASCLSKAGLLRLQAQYIRLALAMEANTHRTADAIERLLQMQAGNQREPGREGEVI